MGVYHYFDGFAGGNWVEHSASGTAYSYGTPFQVNATKYVTKLGWYRKNTGTSRLPTHIGLWDTTTTAEVWGTDSVQDDGTVGWQWTALPNPVAVVANREYRVAIRQPSTNYYSDYTPGSTQTPPSPIFAGANYRCFVQSGNVVYPNSADNQRYEPADVEVDDTGTGGVTPPVLSGDLSQAVSDLEDYIDSQNAQILSMVSNEGTPSQYSIPQQTLDEVQDASTGLASIKGVLDTVATSVGTGLGTAVSGIQTSVGTGLNTVATAAKNAAEATSAFATTAFQWEEDFFNAIYGATGWDAANYGAKMADTLGNLFKWIGALGRSGAVPATGWTLVASTSFTDDLAWAQPADIYVVTFSDIGANDTTTLVSGVDVVYRLGWWLPINGTEPVGQRRFIDTPIVELSDGGARMPGFLLHCPRGGAGTVDAWQFTS